MQNIELKSVLNFSKTNREITNPNSKEDPSAVITGSPTASAAVAATLKNTMGEKQKIAIYVEETLKKNSGVDVNRPQLTPPAVQTVGEENDVASLNAFMASLENPDNISMSEAKLRLETINQNIQAYEAETGQRFAEFDSELANLLNVLARTHKSIATWARVQNGINFNQHELDRAAQEARNSLAVALGAMNKLDVIVAELPPTGDEVREESFKSSTQILYELLASVRETMRDHKLDLLDQQSKLYEVLQTALQNNMTKKADEFKAAQEERKKFTEGMKWLSVALAGLLAFVSGGTAGLVIGLAMATFMAVDLGVMDGKMTEAVINPILEPIMKPLTSLIEKSVNLISDAMIAAGIDEATAMAVAAVVVAVAVAVTVAVVVKGAGALGDFAANSAVGKVAIAHFESMMASVSAGLEKTVFAATKFVSDKVDDFMEKVFQTMLTKIEENFGKKMLYKFMANMDAQKIMNVLGYVQHTSLMGGTSTQAAFTVKAAQADQDAKNISADMTLTNTIHGAITKRLEQFGDEFVSQMPAQDRYTKLLSTLIESEMKTMTFVGRKIAV